MATLNEVFTNIANAIRSKKGTTDKMTPTNMPSEIESIESGGGSSNWTEEPRYSGQVIMTNYGSVTDNTLIYFDYTYGFLREITLTKNGTTTIPATNMAYIRVGGAAQEEIADKQNVELLYTSLGTPLKIILQPKAENWSISFNTSD